ncbi:MAG: 2TM domain-containing protein [Mediterranea sp.]|jgi:hypothetical protein|nr:2TM domain-containing protein [Mediterranea sp.]
MERRIEKRKFMLELKMGVLRYVLVNAFLVFVNWTVTPHYWWVFWVIAGWGLSLSIGLINRYMELKLND